MRQKIILDLDFNQGAIWISDQESGEPITGIDIVDKNKEIALINKKISDLYSSYYEFDSHNEGCWFDSKKFIAEKEVLLSLLCELINKLNEINDGSFEIEDRISKKYNE